MSSLRVLNVSSATFVEAVESTSNPVERRICSKTSLTRGSSSSTRIVLTLEFDKGETYRAVASDITPVAESTPGRFKEAIGYLS